MVSASATTLPEAEAVAAPAPLSPGLGEIAAAFDEIAAAEARKPRRTRTYDRLIQRIMRFTVPRGARVLEIGSGAGDLLAALEPSRGVGVDVSPGMVGLAARRH